VVYTKGVLTKLKKREENLFYKITQNNEDSVTELLCNLCKFDTYRELILTQLKIDGKIFSYADIDTQYKIPKKTKKPDIIIENTDVKIFIENKVSKYRKLESSQLTVYPEHLKNEKNKKVQLIFLIPKGYKYMDKIKEAKKKYDFITIVFWDDLLIEMKKKDSKSEVLNESINYFEKILNSISEIAFNSEEIKTMTNLSNLHTESTAIGKTLELFNNVIGQLKGNLPLKFKRGEKPEQEVSEDRLGYWFYQENCFLGYSFTLMGDKSVEKYVISLAIHKNIVSETKIKKLVEKSFYFDEEWYYFKLNKNWLESEKKENELLLFCEKVMKDIVKEIR
jgi:hypothetical protein